MNGETALRIITVTAFVFILVFMFVAGAIGGDVGTTPAAAAATPIVTPVPEMTTTTTPAPEIPTVTTVAIATTPEPAAADTDPVEGLWVFQGSFTENLRLNPGGAGEMTTITDAPASVREVAWAYDPTIRIGRLRAYHLAIADEGEYVLYLDEDAGTLKRNGQGTVLTYTPAP